MTAGLYTYAALSLAAAQSAVDAATAQATEADVQVAVAVVDRHGALIAFARIDGVSPAAVAIAVDKAVTAATIGEPTAAFADASQPGGEEWGLPFVQGGRFTAMAGGVPVVVADEVVGGVGVSGAPTTVDVACAERGLAEALRFVANACSGTRTAR
jgi:uncharacterized protein GlcG (DUF336 family)